MALPWPQIIDGAIGVIDLLRSRRIRALSARAHQAEPSGGSESLATMTPSVRDEIERERLQLLRERDERERAERQRAELVMMLELQRQAGERELARLRLLAGIAAASWIATLALATMHDHAMASGLAARIVLGFGWALLLAAFALAFVAQNNVASSLAAMSSGDARAMKRGVSSGVAGGFPVWLIVAGLMLAGLAALV
ncbi:MAG TPA: hypothetical protein VGG73_21070 [Vicinamibacterales bacterium]|jgi:hypothetical protein